MVDMVRVLCEAMLTAGITSPESNDGKQFCVEHCPYPCCIVAESVHSFRANTRRATARKAMIKMLAHWMTVNEIASYMGISSRTVRRAINQENTEGNP